jgi:hypothetical protein
MPQNKIIYAGVVVIVATVLLWIGAELTKRIEWLLPWLGGAGVVLLLVGVALEIKNRIRTKP